MGYVWKNVTEYMVKTDANVRREIKFDIIRLATTNRSAANILSSLNNATADCSCNDWAISRQALYLLKKLNP